MLTSACFKYSNLDSRQQGCCCWDSLGWCLRGVCGCGRCAAGLCALQRLRRARSAYATRAPTCLCIRFEARRLVSVLRAFLFGQMVAVPVGELEPLLVGCSVSVSRRGWRGYLLSRRVQNPCRGSGSAGVAIRAIIWCSSAICCVSVWVMASWATIRSLSAWFTSSWPLVCVGVSSGSQTVHLPSESSPSIAPDRSLRRTVSTESPSRAAAAGMLWCCIWPHKCGVVLILGIVLFNCFVVPVRLLGNMAGAAGRLSKLKRLCGNLRRADFLIHSLKCLSRVNCLSRPEIPAPTTRTPSLTIRGSERTILYAERFSHG